MLPIILPIFLLFSGFEIFWGLFYSVAGRHGRNSTQGHHRLAVMQAIALRVPYPRARGGIEMMRGKKLPQDNFCRSPSFRIILVSVKFVSAILGPEMGAPILWTPEKNACFLQEKPCPQNSPFLGGFWGGRGGECRFYFYGRADFSDS